MKEQIPKFTHFLKGKAAAVSDSDILEKKNIVLNCKSVAPEEAIRACGKLMLESGYIEDGYIQAMLERDSGDSAAVGSHVAIPHGTKDSLEFIQRTGVAVMTYPDGIQWDGRVVRLVIGIASKGEEHLELLNRIVEMIQSEEDTDALVDNATEEELYRQLNG
nr:PTS sugar transporter subunit IIA [uncultured Oscillibacter sp.]